MADAADPAYLGLHEDGERTWGVYATEWPHMVRVVHLMSPTGYFEIVARERVWPTRPRPPKGDPRG